MLTVNIVTPSVENWVESMQSSGPISTWQEIIVSPETGGLRIAELLVDVGTSVKRGQLLARLADDSLQADLRKQQAAVAQARAALEQAVSNVKRAKVVEGSGALSAQKIEEYRISEATAQAQLAAAEAELESIRIKLRQTRIVALDDGVVSSKSAVLGNVVNAGAELFRLVRQGRVEWRPELDARQLATIRVGQLATLTLPNGEQLEGRVRLIGPTLNTATARATVYVSLPLGSAARAGMFASGIITTGSHQAQTLPQSAVTLRDGRAYVYLLDDNKRTYSRVITTGRRQGQRVEVFGLANDAQVVADGGAFLSDGAHVAVKQAAQHKPEAQQ